MTDQEKIESLAAQLDAAKMMIGDLLLQGTQMGRLNAALQQKLEKRVPAAEPEAENVSNGSAGRV